MTSHMARETLEAPEVVAQLIRRNAAGLAELRKLYAARQPSHIVTVARGSSDHAAGYFKYLVEILLGIPCASVGASSVSIYDGPLALRDCIVVAISQSGSAPDLLAYAAAVKRAGVPLVVISNHQDSDLARAADICLILSAGPELSVAATKTFIASVALVARIAAEWAGLPALIAATERLPTTLEAASALRWDMFEEAMITAKSLFVLGRGPSLPIANEIALKLKETSQLHAEAFSAAEVVHGPMEVVDAGFPVLLLSPSDAASVTNRVTAGKLLAAGAKLYCVSKDSKLPSHLDFQPAAHVLFDPISIIQTFYGAAERISRARGRDPDRPRLLSKVTKTL